MKGKCGRLFWGLIPIVQVVWSQTSDLMSQDKTTPKGFMFVESNPVIKYKLRSFERIESHFYSSNYYVKSTTYNNNKMIEKIFGLKQREQSERRKTGHQKIFKWDIRKGKAEIEKQKPQLDWNQLNQTLLLLASQSPLELLGVLREINDIYNRIKLKALSSFLMNIKAELEEVERSLTIDTLGNFFEFLEKVLSDEEVRNKLKMADRNKFKGLNNKGCNSQSQSENVLAFNRLSEKNNSNLKETDVEVFNELTARKMNELLEKAVNNLNEEGTLPGDVPTVTQAAPQKNQMDFLEQLQRNFSRMFHSQNAMLKYINQMSKIIDFVERYHGILNDLKIPLMALAYDNRMGRHVEKKKEKIEASEDESKALYDERAFVSEIEDFNEKAPVGRYKSVGGFEIK